MIVINFRTLQSGPYFIDTNCVQPFTQSGLSVNNGVTTYQEGVYQF